MKKRSLSVCLVLFFIFVAMSTSLFGCSNNRYTSISNDVKNYYTQTISLKSNDKYTFNVNEIFKDSGLKIEKYKIETEDDKNYTVSGDTITAVGTGVSSISVSLYCPSERTRYVCSLGTLYSYDEKDFTPISTVSELQGITDLNGKYILTADIDLSSIKNWEPIGNLPHGNAFTGMFINPYGYKIKNLTITSSKEIFHGPYGGCCAGLFGSITGAFLYGIHLENVQIDVSDFDGVSYSEAGGIAGLTSASYIKDCIVTGDVKAVGRTGGIAGSVNWGCIENCSFSGNVTANEELSEYALSDGATGAGGIAGYIGIPCPFQVYQYGLIGCTAKGKVTAAKNAGGIAGYIWGSKYAKNCTFDGDATANFADILFGKIQENIH
ncbi:MAG: hypothetical protein K2K48_04145 [Anaeroplasmataceae bacterium]|nr:hypothetical protein [Anaeroplasmataceae bacterium]MDE6414583.1 hypothetical protein [Anaeroplasmataceae bacterium]